ncbi:hypothetical protein [Tenacibaculum aiptasiae]|uniref:GlsB/YeaQ/YmgE family stress response membrane protein n=1 Tax=Tenacibaculum aiptasiae TaxID=426481 RepID=A0A7J5ARQ2_9FLAO|nr:hypothetical protein [Tenacibaculum aiptasiae]KAB1160307.1 hypothetical protein F7018_00070 [Tenacibaculum aiptasiae]
MELIISLLSGAVGGNIAGALLKKYSLGTLWNSVVGILGGGLGAQLLGMLNIDISGIIGNIIGSGVGGGVLMVIIGLIKGAMKK